MKCKRRIISLLLCMIMVLATVASPTVAEAADEAIVYEEYTNVASTYRGESKTYPTDKAGYVFAGWYAKSGSNYSAMSEAAADAATTAYAKFVKQEVLSMKFQLTEGTTAIAKETTLRLITSVDSLDYSSVGFRIQLGEQETTRTSKVVYSAINGYTKDGVTSYTPQETFHECSKYFMTHSVSEITTDVFATAWTFTPMWTTLDGTTVDGVTRDNLAISDEVPNGVLDILTFDDAADMHNAIGGSGLELNRMELEGENVAGGSSATSNKYPRLNVNLGRTYDTDVKVTFKMLLQATSEEVDTTTEMACYLNSTTNWVPVVCNNEWKTLTITIPAGESSGWIYVNLEWYNWWDDVMFYFDDVEVIGPLNRTLTFDRASDLQYAIGRSGLVLSQMELDGENVAGGSSATSNRYPGLNVNLGRTYDTDVTVTFKMLLEATSEDVDTGRELACYLNSGNWVPVMCNNTWKTLTITIPAGQSSGYIYVDLQWFDTWWDDVMFYFDDVKASLPWSELTFDKAEDLEYAIGRSGLVLSQMELDGENVAGGSSATSNRYPGLSVNLGRTYDTDVTVTFKMLLKATSEDVDTGRELACYLNSNSWVPVVCNNTWKTLTITIPAGQSSGYIYVDLHWFDTWWDDIMFYFDDVEVIGPLNRTLTFDRDSDMTYITGVSGLSVSRAVLEQKNVLKGINANAGSAAYPGIKINLGATYDTAVTVQFKIYPKTSTPTSSTIAHFCTVGGSNAAINNIPCNEWTTLSFSVPAGNSSAQTYARFEYAGEIALSSDVTFYFDDFTVIK